MIKTLLTGIIITICIGGFSSLLLLRYGDPTLSWNTYVNMTYGFTLRYPRGLELTTTPINVEQARLIYDAFCKKQEGCGGARWPEYVLNFETEEKMSVFMVDIHQVPVTNGHFTYIVREPYNIYYFQDLKDIPKRFISEKTLQMIQKSIRFIPPHVPLGCLWNNAHRPALPDTYRTQIEFEEKIATVSGYFFEKQKNTCEKTTYDTWIYDVQNTSPPFASKSYCETVCLKKQ